MTMTKVKENNIFDINQRHRNNFFTPAPDEFITSSSTNVRNSKFPLNYPYNIYNPNAWETLGPPPGSNVPTQFQTNGKLDVNKVCWWSPDQEHVVSEFMEASSMHGLKYVSQKKRHLFERVFWAVAFVSCVVAAGLMISEVWNRYYSNPVIVTFNPVELDLDVIPFPSVTICNVNPFKRSKVDQFINTYRTSTDEQERKQSLEALRIINSICSSRPSLLKSLNYVPNRGEIPIPEVQLSPSPETEQNMTEFLLEHTQPCRELLRVCAWEHTETKCEELFKPILTDFGKCCTFNMLPQELMEYVSTKGSTVVHSEHGAPSWNKSEVKEWTKWEYEEGYLLGPDLKYPYRQHRAGMLDGLSLVVDPDVTNSFCPSSDSEGVKILFHLPLDAPRVADLGFIIGTDREIFLEVHPDVTIADEDIESYGHEQRKCYFGKEYNLSIYRPYTRSNCLEECLSELLYRECQCLLYYTPRNLTANVCSSMDKLCIKKVEDSYLGKLNRQCSQCKYSCNDLSYNSEVTYATLQPKDVLWAEGNRSQKSWMTHKVSIIHIFMGTDTTVPKLRQKLYQTVDLIANTGGLLGLSIGFSVLSLVEILYFATMRICCKRMRKSSKYGAIALSPGLESETTRTSNASQNNNRNGFNRFPMNNSRFIEELNNKNYLFSGKTLM